MFITFFTLVYDNILAAPDELLLWTLNTSILNASSVSEPVVILTLIQSILLKVVLPVIIVGSSLYIAYELFTADGDESKLKKAWKSITYTAIALISIALSYALVSIVSGLSF
jgi:hypothetical protein